MDARGCCESSYSSKHVDVFSSLSHGSGARTEAYGVLLVTKIHGFS
jgi:hypothetical protein